MNRFAPFPQTPNPFNNTRNEATSIADSESLSASRHPPGSDQGRPGAPFPRTPNPFNTSFQEAMNNATSTADSESLSASRHPPTPVGGKRRVRVVLSSVYFLVYTFLCKHLLSFFPSLYWGRVQEGAVGHPLAEPEGPSPCLFLRPPWKSLSHEPPALRHSGAPRAPTIAPMTTLARKMVPKWDPKMEPRRASDK